MKNRTLILALIVTAPVLRGDACAPLLEDPAFELWCGDALCAWSVDTGSVARAPTWHPADYGVELVGPEARISQRLRRNVRCLGVTTLADIDETASLELALDFFDDGTIEHRQPIVGANWARVSFVITAPAWYEGARVIVRKSGAGRAVLAELDVSERDPAACTGAPVELHEAALGAPCARDGDCLGGRCAAGLLRSADAAGDLGTVCGTCKSDADCGADELCGVTTASPFLPYAACVRRGADPLGAACAVDAECGSGICCTGSCSTCCRDGRGACAAGACGNGLSDDARLVFGVPDPAWVCEPGMGRRAAGEPCVAASDCGSGTCSSTVTLSYCLWSGRDCAGDASCGAGSTCGAPVTPGVCR